MTTEPDAIFPRSFARRYLLAERGEGVYLFDAQGKRYLDACGGAAVVSIGYGIKEVLEAVQRQAAALPYVHASQFHTRAGIELAQFLQTKFPGPPQAARVHFTSGGSEATETAIKMVLQYWRSQGRARRTKILSRWHGYHGATLGALALSGHRGRRLPFEAVLPPVRHISTCFCYHCPLGLSLPSCELACARELETAIAEEGADSVAGFILEPMVGATSGAVPPDGYLRTIREICDAHDILLIADEVMTGAGRTGKYFAVEHWDVVPDIVLLGKGLSSGYAPLGAVLASEKVWRAIESGTGGLEHGFTYQGHPPSLAAGLAVQRYGEKHELVTRAQAQGEKLASRLERLREHAHVGDVRGKGLLQTVEFVADRATRAPFAPQQQFSRRLFEGLAARGVLVYPMAGTVDGVQGDHILLAPPFVIEDDQIEFLVGEIESALDEVARDLSSAVGN